MPQCSIIINVSDQPHLHSNGLSGQYIVPAKGEDDFGLLVVYPGREIQDRGNNNKDIHPVEARILALDIIGAASDASAHVLGSRGGMEKWGLLLSAAEPELPQELEVAMRAEREYLDANPPDVKFRKDQRLNINVAVNVEADSIKAEKIKLSSAVLKLRSEFESGCRKLVSKGEVTKVKQALQLEDQKLISVGDAMYAQGEQARKNINELHQRACRRSGQTRPWCYTPEQLVDCPGCGAKIKENILSCPQCSGWLDEGIPELHAMKPKERAQKMYPERYAEPMPAKR